MWVPQCVCEVHIHTMHTQDCSLLVFHPYRSLTAMLREPDVPQDQMLVDSAWALLNDSYRTDICMCTPPYIIAIGRGYLLSVMTALILISVYTTGRDTHTQRCVQMAGRRDRRHDRGA